VRVQTGFTSRVAEGAVSEAPYAAWNLGDHVGDDPAAVGANRALLGRRLGVADDRLVFMRQVHGSDVAVVDGGEQRQPEADALVTSTPGIALVVLVADCVPLLLTDAAAGVVAAVHVGRRGVAANIVTAAVDRMRGLGARDVWGRLGPCIGACCYAVGEDVQDEVAAGLPAIRSRTREGRPSLDLRAGVVAQLAALGITQVSADAACTAEDPRCYSYRRDTVTGRMAGVVVLSP
jgi:YfiH family protein